MLDKIEAALWTIFFIANLTYYAIDDFNPDRLVIALIALVMFKLVIIEVKLRRME